MDSTFLLYLSNLFYAYNMRKLFLPLLLITITIFASCESTETNSPGFQSNIDSVFFNANDVRGFINQEGQLIIQGYTTNQTVTLNLNGAELTTYTLGGNSSNYATYEDENGTVYSTTLDGNGMVALTNSNLSEGWYSGEFEFRAFSTFGTSVTFNRGIFFQAPIVGFAEEEQEEEEGQEPVDGFAANIGGLPFVPTAVTTAASDTSISISGSTPARGLVVRVPIDVTVGNYSLPASGYLGSYTEGALTEIATSGNISIITHDTVGRSIKGSFSFTTQGQVVESGQFNVTY